jgi:hypothetical protein
MTEILFDADVVITTSITYSKFIVRNIDIKFDEPAKVDVMLIQKIPVSIPLYETIEIPLEVYTAWQYDKQQIIDFCKTYIQNKFSTL